MHLERFSTIIKRKNSDIWIPVIFISLVFFSEILIILVLNGGHFVYTFDDAYIHLSQAENIIKGHYGVNLNEYSAPSSSIIWPFIISPFTILTFGHYIPLFISFISSIGIIILFSLIIRKVLYGINPDKKNAAVIFFTIFLLLSTNLIGIAFTGMEYIFHIFLSVLILYGLICEREKRICPWWLGMAIVIGTLVRYENLALAVPALVYLASRKHYKTSLTCGIVLAVTVGGFSLFLYSMDLGFFPTSILVKSGAISSGGNLKIIISQLWDNLRHSLGAQLTIGLFLLIFYILFGKNREDRILALWASSALILQFLMGIFSLFAGHGIYMWVIVLLTLIYLYRELIKRFVQYEPVYKIVLILSFWFFIVCAPFLGTLLLTPFASNNIYCQQYQMHRFVADYYSNPVAINDLGLVSYRNDNYVLDLNGLASRKALNFRRNKDKKDVDWMNLMAKENNVKLVMIYDLFFPEIPENWIRVGELHLGKKNITPASSIVAFYVLDIDTLSSVRSLLYDFQKTLPEGVKFVFRDRVNR